MIRSSEVIFARAVGWPAMLALALSSCKYPEPADTPQVRKAPPAYAHIRLETRVTSQIDAPLRGACVDSVIAVLKSHGFVLDPDGPRVDIEIALHEDMTATALPSNQGLGFPSDRFDSPPAPQRALTADLTAKVELPGLRQKVLRTAGTAQDACAAAAERLYEPLVATFAAPPDP